MNHLIAYPLTWDDIELRANNTVGIYKIKNKIAVLSCVSYTAHVFPLIETIPMKIGRKKLLRISKSTGDYDHFYIVWNPKSKKISAYDLEHEELYDLCSFKDFMEDISTYLQKVIDGDI